MNTPMKSIIALAVGSAITVGSVAPALADPVAPSSWTPRPSAGSSNAVAMNADLWKAGLALGTLTEEVQHSGYYVQKDVEAAANQYPGQNVLMIQDESPQVYNLKGVTAKVPVTVGTNNFTLWVFDTGTVTNNGDLGYQNWAWMGHNWDRSGDHGKTVTFH